MCAEPHHLFHTSDIFLIQTATSFLTIKMSSVVSGQKEPKVQMSPGEMYQVQKSSLFIVHIHSEVHCFHCGHCFLELGWVLGYSINSALCKVRGLTCYQSSKARSSSGIYGIHHESSLIILSGAPVSGKARRDDAPAAVLL